jgi:hypothetical protein
MPGHSDGQRTYAVHGSGVIAAALKEIQSRANQEGRGKQVLAAIEQVHRRLRRDPNGFGEPIYRLPALRMQVRTAVVGPLVIDFGVCEDRPLVFIKVVRLLPA